MKHLPKATQERINVRNQCFSEVGHGWFSLLEELDRELAALFPNYTIGQVKEKFGVLRIYVDHVDERAYDIIDKYEKKSATICELCGKPGQTVSLGYWLKTLCPEHEAQIKK